MKAMVKKRQQRKIVANKETIFILHDFEVEPAKIVRYMKRKGIPEDQCYSPSSPFKCKLGHHMSLSLDVLLISKQLLPPE